MDIVQKTLVKIVQDYPQCISDKVMLRGLLTDFLPQNCREINLVMNAYETRIVDRLLRTRDYHLEIGNVKKQLLQEYGLTDQASIWAIASWCFMLNLPAAAKIAAAELTEEIEPDKPEPEDYKTVLDFLKSKKMKVIDKRPAGGCLWVIGTEGEIGKVIKETERRFTISGSFCGGGKATGYKPGWYTTTDK